MISRPPSSPVVPRHLGQDHPAPSQHFVRHREKEAREGLGPDAQVGKRGEHLGEPVALALGGADGVAVLQEVEGAKRAFV